MAHGSDMFELRRLLALYRERLQLLDSRDPGLALVALGEEGEYARYRWHFTRKIWQLEAEMCEEAYGVSSVGVCVGG